MTENCSYIVSTCVQELLIRSYYWIVRNISLFFIFKCRPDW
jgi:hypothetical protein